MRTLFVDFHGTICHDPFWRSLDSDDFGRVQQAVFETDPSLVNGWMRGKYSSEQINELVAERTGLPLDRLWQTFVRDCKSMHIAPDLLTQITALRKAYSVILITDNMDCFDRFTVPALHLDAVFDGLVNLFSEGRLKTDDYLNGVDRKRCLTLPLGSDWGLQEQAPPVNQRSSRDGYASIAIGFSRLSLIAVRSCAPSAPSMTR